MWLKQQYILPSLLKNIVYYGEIKHRIPWSTFNQECRSIL
jgi:hypothetical protein